MTFPIEQFQKLQTPFYYYDTELLDATLREIHTQIEAHPNYHVHYAVKACTNATVLRHIAQSGLGADCVSGGEIRTCLEAGFPADQVVYAGVGKSDWEINLALEAGIFCFNVESIPELEVINQLAQQKGKVARVAFRINPNVGAHTHANITTGLSENKFGIDMADMERVIVMAQDMTNVEFIGLHFHIGSQLLVMDDYVALCHRINELQDRLEAQGITSVANINVGGGLGIDYQEPDEHPVPNFKDYFAVFAQYLNLRDGQQLHFELGRAVVGQCGNLVTRVLYVKQAHKQFVIVDAGMTELIRPALYDAYHKVDNLTSHEPEQVYDVVGPICESSDVFVKDYTMPATRRGDLIALRSAGAYGEIMASCYNCRPLPKAYCTEDFK